MSTAFPSVFRIMGTGQRNMLRDGWEQFPEHMYPEGSITGHHIIGVKVCFPLGVEGVRIDAGADIVQLHLGRIADVHAVDLD